jgi:hypothetical protein
VQHNGDVGRQHARACFAALLQDAWHAVRVGKLARSTRIADRDFTSTRRPFVPPVVAWPHERFAEEPAQPPGLSIKALLAQTSPVPATTWFDSNYK